MKLEAGMIFLLFILLISLSSSQVNDEGIPEEIEGITNISEGIVDVGTNITQGGLTEEWKKMFLENKLIRDLDSLFTKISIVFRILFGIPYSFSLTLLLVIVLWLIIFLKVASIMRKGLGFNDTASYGLGAVVAIALAQLQVLSNLISVSLEFAFSQEAATARIIIFILIGWLFGMDIVGNIWLAFSIFLLTIKGSPIVLTIVLLGHIVLKSLSHAHNQIFCVPDTFVKLNDFLISLPDLQVDFRTSSSS